MIRSPRLAAVSGGLFITALTAILLLSSPVRAERAAPVEMDLVCTNWLTQLVHLRGDWAGSSDPAVLGVHDIFAGDTLLGRYYDIAPRGFVLVTALKEMTPVKAYSDQFNLDENQAEGFLGMVTEVLSERTALYARTFGSLDAVQPSSGPAIFGQGQKGEWTRLTLPEEAFREEMQAKGSRSIAEAGPLTRTSWNQSAPYNNYCPMGETGRSVVGCVATATAQILAYWQWPPSGLGSHTYTWDGDQYCGGNFGGGVLSATFSDTYDWANIVDSCDLGCNTAQQNALAELCYEVGVAFDMDYSSCGSAASTARAVAVFPTYFKFSTEIRRLNRSSYTLSEWYDLAKHEIDTGRVIQYRINAHSIVLDGYREQTPGRYEYHMNYGWANSFNAWYVLDSLYCGWIDGDICPANEEFMITHIFPQTRPAMALAGHAFSEATGNGNGRANSGEAINLNMVVGNDGNDATNPVVTVSTTDPYVTVQQASASLGEVIVWGGQGATALPVVVSIAPGCPDPHRAVLTLSLSAEGGYATTDSVLLFIGNTPGMTADFETIDGLWWHRAHTPMYGDQWHLETYRKHSGSSSWKVGGLGSALYDNSLDAALVSPPFLLPVNPQLSFWHWRDFEDDQTAWDGGIVMISTNGGDWVQITPEGGYPGAIYDNPDNALPGGTPCYNGHSDWTEAVFDLSGYSGVAQVMFRFASDGSATEEGWYVDDVQVISTGCCIGMRGNIDGDALDKVLVSDLTFLVNRLFRSGPESPCAEEADVDGSSTLNVTDLTQLVNYLFRSGPSPAACP